MSSSLLLENLTKEVTPYGQHRASAPHSEGRLDESRLDVLGATQSQSSIQRTSVRAPPLAGWPVKCYGREASDRCRHAEKPPTSLSPLGSHSADDMSDR